MLTIGLTGGIASGKSTVAAIFREHGAVVFDADRAVHALYAGVAAPLVEAAFPGTTAGGAVDRAALGARVAGDPAALAKLEGLIHPLVHEAEARARAEAKAAGARLFVVDSPLLLEAGRGGGVDVVVVASAPEALRRQRALARPGMTEGRFDALNGRQMPDSEKRARAHFVVDTGGALDVTRATIGTIVRALAGTAAGK